MRTEQDLRAKRGLVGVRVRMQDGASWTVPARPLVGPAADAILAGLRELERLRFHGVHLHARLQRDIHAAKAKVEALPRETAPEVTAAALAEFLPAVEAIQADAEANARAMLASTLDVIGAALRLNYPAITHEEVAALVSVGHLAPVLSIIRGERELEDLFGAERARDPSTA